MVRLAVILLLLVACTKDGGGVAPNTYTCQPGSDAFYPFMKLETGNTIEYDVQFTESCLYDGCTFANPLCYIGYFDPLEMGFNFAWRPDGDSIELFTTARADGKFVILPVGTVAVNTTHRMRIDVTGGLVQYYIDNARVMVMNATPLRRLWVSTPWMGGDCNIPHTITLKIRFV